MFYFNKESINPDELDVEQFTKVKKFKETVSNLGGLYNEYNGKLEFENNFKKHIQKVLLKRENCHNGEKLANELESKNNKISDLYIQRFEKSLRTYSSQPIFWIDPILSKSDEILPNPDDDTNNIVDVSEIYNLPKTLIIKAPPQFGLTCLSHFILKEAYDKNSFIGLYLDSETFKSNAVDKVIDKELKVLDVKIDCVKLIILDSWSNLEIDSFRILKRIAENYSEIPLIVMQRIDDSKYQSQDEDIAINREFEVLHFISITTRACKKGSRRLQ